MGLVVHPLVALQGAHGPREVGRQFLERTAVRFGRLFHDLLLTRVIAVLRVVDASVDPGPLRLDDLSQLFGDVPTFDYIKEVFTKAGGNLASITTYNPIRLLKQMMKTCKNSRSR